MSKKYKSSNNRLVNFFESSRDKWKERSGKHYQEKRKLSYALRDVTRSREKWKDECRKLKEENRKLLNKEKKTKELLNQILNI
jgi:hypothetical protein